MQLDRFVNLPEEIIVNIIILHRNDFFRPKKLRRRSKLRYNFMHQIFHCNNHQVVRRFCESLLYSEIQVMILRYYGGKTLTWSASFLRKNESEIHRIESSYLAKSVTFLNELRSSRKIIESVKKENEQIKLDMVAAIQRLDAIMKSGINEIQSVKDEILSELSPDQKQMFISFVSNSKQKEVTA